jgi:tripartite-type tricarboxylate transporter receptor subunit TctC
MYSTARFAIGVMIACSFLPGEVGAQTYPDRPIRFILPYSPGGSYDAVARLFGQALAEKWGQQVIVENRPGAAGRIGMEVGIKATPDGHSLIMLGNNQTITPSVHRIVPYDLTRDIDPVGMVATINNVLVVHPSVPVGSVAELLALAKSKPGTINFGSGGTGGITHLAGELFKSMSSVNIVHVPFKGGAFAVIGVVGGETQMMLLNMLNSAPHIKANRLRGLAVTSLKRSAYLPNLPTLDESGLKGYEIVEWYAVAVPVKTPKQIIAKLSDEITRIANSADTKEKLARQNAEVAPGTPQQLRAFLKADLAKYARIVKDAGIKPE